MEREQKAEKKIVLKNLKGTRDFLPAEQMIRDNIISVLKQIFLSYGYLPVETPILNEYELLKYKYGDGAEILSEIYKMKDQGDRDVGLRFDLTVPFCKLIGLNKDLILPFRRYEIGKVFRDGPVKTGRAREFYQCDVDVVGIDGRYVEAEQMQMVVDAFCKLGIDVVIKWNNRKLMCGLLESLGYQPCQLEPVIALIDRLDKISFDELVLEFEKLGRSKTDVETLLSLFEKSLADYADMFGQTEIKNLRCGIDECLQLQDLLQKLGLQNHAQFSPKLARGQNIYTGTVFEFFDKQNRISSSLGGGGRYDKIITDFMSNGQKYSAVGLSFGLEPIYCLLSQSAKSSFVDVLIVPMGTEAECIGLAKQLRSVGAKTIVELSGKRVKKAFEYANKMGAKFVIVVGEDEIALQQYSIKDMQSGVQQQLSIDNLLNFVKENI